MLRKIGKWLGILILLVLLALIVGVATGKTEGERRVPAGLVRNTARYLVMRDSVEIAIDVWLPPTLAAGDKAPTVINSTRYVRAMARGPLATLQARRGSQAGRAGVQ
jgi:uncharacterized protein